MTKLIKYCNAILHIILIAYFSITSHNSPAQNLRLELQGLHSDTIDYFSKSFDGKYTITSGRDGLTKVWDSLGSVILSVEGYQNTIWSYGFEGDKYNTLNGGSATNGSELVVVDGSSGVVRCFDMGSKKVTRLFKTDSIISFKKNMWRRMGYGEEVMDEKLVDSRISAKAYFTRINNGDVLVIERHLSFFHYNRDNITIVELWSRSTDKIVGTFLGSSLVVSKLGELLAINGTLRYGKEKEGTNVYKIKNGKIEHYKTLQPICPTPIAVTAAELTLYKQGQYIPSNIKVENPKEYESKIEIISLTTSNSRLMSDTEFNRELKKEIQTAIGDKWNRVASNLQLIKRAEFSKKDQEILITSLKSTTVVDFNSGQVKKIYFHPSDTNSSPVKLVPIKTLDSIIFRPTNVGRQPLVTGDFKFAVFPANSQIKYSGLASIVDLQKDHVLEYPNGPDSLYAFQFSPNGLWRVELRDFWDPLMNRDGYNNKGAILLSLFYKDKLIFQTDEYCDLDFSSNNKWIKLRNPRTGVSMLFPLLDVQDQFHFLPIMSVSKLPKKSKRDTTESLFKGNIYADTTVLRFLFNSICFAMTHNSYSLGRVPYDISAYAFWTYRYALSEVLLKNKTTWDQLAKDTIGLDFKSSWISCRWGIAEPQEIKSFSSFFINVLEEKPTNWFKLSPNGRYLLTITETREQEFIHSISRDGDKINLTLKLHDSWNRTSTTINRTDKELPAYKVKFSEDGSLMYYIIEDKLIVINSSSQSVYHTFTLDAEIQNGDISLDNSKLIITTRSEVSIWDIKNKMKMLSFQLTEDGKLLARHPQGLFDASVKLLDEVHFVQNGSDVISISQLKERYYEPGLWKKVISGEKLREVATMKSIELPPDIKVGQVDTKGYLPIDLTNKGGGIGEVTVLINGKEAIIDARPKGSDSKAKQLSLNVFIGNNKTLVKGAENYIAVKAWNEGHWVVSRGVVVTYSVEGINIAYKPAIHIITSGVSDYTGTELDLKYAAKDAEDVSKALQLGAKQLFGTEKSYIYNLTTSQPNTQYPTKSNILRTFERVSSIAHPLDVVVVYLSGHGINYGGQDGDWYYLTQDAYTSNSTAYNDPEIRRTSTLSSNELVDLFKNVPALKQVLIIDACASGKVVENLMAKKDIESTTLRALDRMRDRTGLHIITGCTADAVSYEASKYGQGVLTYSLLEGIRGAALREDQFVDINKLFQYAHDRVPALAVGIGGIQTPQVFSPQGAQSFDIGLLTELEKKDIPIAKIRPVYIRSSFIDDDQLEDALQLGKKVDDALNEAAVKGAGAPLIFVDVREYPEGCKLSGKYKQVKGIIKLKLRKKCEGKDETIEISGKTAEEVAGKIISSL